MKILILNSGSSSIKYKLYDIEKDFFPIATGLVDRIGLKGSSIKHHPNKKEPITIKQDVPKHKLALELIGNALTDPSHGVIKNFSEIKGDGEHFRHGLAQRKVIQILDRKLASLNRLDVAFHAFSSRAVVIGQ